MAKNATHGYNQFMRHFFTNLVKSRKVSTAYTELTFSWPQGLRRPLPGQFLTFRIHPTHNPFLRRPFSLSSWNETESLASVLIQERGPGSSALCALKPGSGLDILGPRGFSFPFKHQEGDHRPFLLVGGGIGTGPMLFAAQYLNEKQQKIRLCLGFRDINMIPSWEWPESYHAALAAENLTQETERVQPGRVLDLVEKTFLKEGGREVWACGPTPMLKAVSDWASEKGVPCFVLVEEMMACGVGACMGCAVPVNDGRGYLRSCTEGPVFDARLIDWSKAWT